MSLRGSSAAGRLQTIHFHISNAMASQHALMSPLTTHVLDASRGQPAAGLNVMLYRQETNDSWILLNSSVTNSDGRCPNLIAQSAFVVATYKLFFDTGGYFVDHGVDGFYPYVEIVFRIKEPGIHYHVPLLLSPFAYSTYRGS